MDGWMDGWMAGWLDGWMDGWMDNKWFLPLYSFVIFSLPPIIKFPLPSPGLVLDLFILGSRIGKSIMFYGIQLYNVIHIIILIHLE